MERHEDSRVLSGLKVLFAVCFFLAVLAVVTVQYPLFGTVLYLGALLFICCRYEIPRFSLVLFGFSLIIHLAAVAVITTPIVSDFGLQYEAARKFAAGDYSFQNSSYFQKWGYQTGLVVYQGLLLKLWDSPMFLRLVNCVVSAGTNVLVYLIARDCFSKITARCVSLAYATFLYPATLVTVLCNNIPSAFFLYLALYLVIGKRFEGYRRIAVYSCAGLSLALANALRPDAPLLLVPLLVYFVFRFLSRFTRQHFFDTLKRFLALFLTFLVISSGLSGLIKATGINSAGLGNNDPLWGAVVGTNPKFQGAYNNEDGLRIAEKQEAGLERKAAELEVIKEHFNTSPANLAQLLTDKIKKLWWDRSLAWSMGSVRDNAPRLYKFLEELDGALFTCMLVLAALGALALFLKRKGELKLYLLPFIIFTTFFVYLLLEVQPRYAYVMQIAVFLLAAGGLESLLVLGKQICVKLSTGKAISRKTE